MAETSPDTIIIEDAYKPTDKALTHIGGIYDDFYTFRSQRDGSFEQIQGKTLVDFWTESRNIFWNSTTTKSEDLEALGLDFALPLVRKEVLDFTGRLVSMNIIPELSGDDLGIYGTKVLQAMYKKWRLKSKDRVEKFWQTLYGTINGTLCNYVGYNMDEQEFKYLTSISDDRKKFNLTTNKRKKWDDAFTMIVPLEEIYLEKIWERNIQKQGKTIRRQEMTLGEFRREFPESKYPHAKHVVPGNRISEDSLFFSLLSGTEMTDKIEVLRVFDTDNDKHTILASGVWINSLGTDTPAPNPFKHKSQPYTWTVNEPIDEKFAYGMSMPFNLKGTNKILQTSYSMLVERELRVIDPPIITSDFEAPSLIFGQKRVIPVNDINAYKEFQLNEASGAYFTMMNSLQGMMTSMAQGGTSQMAPSRQPKSAREIMEMEKMKQQAMGNALIMYYDLIHQELFLLLKTMLQFYPAKKYATDNLVRLVTLPNAALTRGGVGTLEVRIVKEPQSALRLYFEGVQKSIENGKPTEIIEVPVDLIENLEWFIDDIRLEAEKSSDLERSLYVEQVLTPMLQAWIPMGQADPAKAFKRHLEKLGESVADYAPDQMQGAQVAGQQLPQGQQTGAMNQSVTGTQYGNQNAEALMQ